ncbi:hypothetical protein INT46_003866 [Mucor plumbeus]|uniref:PH domain-containing protein n=1 Tax=Mucor plumbeus TaxID=97098 RepID=A0A8H7QS92_9FUNG|nr:hypothetical protein INT46_003866 [Mucor plumbeus]
MAIFRDKPPQYSSSPPPSYSCTVYKQGFVRLKKEIDIGGGVEINRSWRTVYFCLRGTVLNIYKKETSKYPINSISMLKVNCGIATDYKKDNVLRLRLGTTKEQYLIMPLGSLSETVSWFEHLQSSANISADIDKRRMPRFLTLSRGNSQLQERLNNTKTITLTVGKTQAVIPVLKCQPRGRL